MINFLYQKIKPQTLCRNNGKKNIARYILLLKNVTEDLKIVIYVYKKNRKKVSLFT